MDKKNNFFEKIRFLNERNLVICKLKSPRKYHSPLRSMTSGALTNNIGKMGGRVRDEKNEESKANFTMEYNIDSPTN
jgi:hypothetical protein